VLLNEPGSDRAVNFDPSAELQDISEDFNDLHQAQDYKDTETKNNIASEFFKKNTDKPMVQLVNLDLNFAKIGTYLMFGRMFLGRWMPNNENHPGDQPKNFISFIDDMMFKFRQVCQYSIHARPHHIARDPDDISSDTVHNLEAVALGRKVYNYNAFVAPWLGVLKLFFPHSNDKIIGIPSRMLHSADEVMSKITNLFWNVRRISKGLIPYDGGMKTKTLSDKQNAVRELITYVTSTCFIKPYMALRASLGDKGSKTFKDQLDWQEKVDKSQIKGIFTDAASNWFGNVKALFNKNYHSPHEPDKNAYKPVGSEEPQNHHLYVRSKILSQVLGLPAGLIGGVSNALSICLNVFGNLIDNKAIIKSSDYLTNLANSLMAMVYITGEVPANVNEYIKRKKQNGIDDKRHLVVAGIGVVGMLNRIKYAPIVGSMMQGIGLKGILDKFHNQFEKMFLGFFSANRWLLHDYERAQAEEVASAEELDLARKHESIYKLTTLPFRVILGDKEVTYKEDTKKFYRQSSPTTFPTA
jgi:hypothetical protein